MAQFLIKTLIEKDNGLSRLVMVRCLRLSALCVGMENNFTVKKRFIDVKDLAVYLSTSRNTIQDWKRKGLIPSKKMNRLVRYDLNEIDEWIKTGRMN